MDAIAFLREDHVKVLAMLDELERAPVDGRSARMELVTELVIAESEHEAIEEQYFCRACSAGSTRAVT
ncbi:MAG: hemerythrin domain-containing protein [Pseudonocardiaceae bacterium]